MFQDFMFRDLLDHACVAQALADAERRMRGEPPVGGSDCYQTAVLITSLLLSDCLARASDPSAIQAAATMVWTLVRPDVTAAPPLQRLEWACAGLLAGRGADVRAALQSMPIETVIAPASIQPWQTAVEEWAITAWLWLIRADPGDRESAADLGGLLHAVLREEAVPANLTSHTVACMVLLAAAERYATAPDCPTVSATLHNAAMLAAYGWPAGESAIRWLRAAIAAQHSSHEP